MSEAVVEQEAVTEPAEEVQKPTDTVEFWKQKSREQEKRAKANADAAKRLAELEESNKSEGDKLSERLTAAERRAEVAEARALRLQVAAEKGLTPSQARRLVGDTLEELEADADDLLESFRPAEEPEAKGKSRKPRERLQAGSEPDGAVALNGDPIEQALRNKLGII